MNKRGRRWRKWLVRGLILAAVIVLILATGKPQEYAAESIAGRALGAEVRIAWGGTFPDIRIDTLEVYSPDGGEPVARVSNISVDYTLWGNDGRRLRSVDVGDVALFADYSDPEHPNIEFLYALLEGESTETDTTFLPQQASVDTINIEAHFPDGSLSVDGIGLIANCDASGNWSADIDSEDLDTAWRLTAEDRELVSENGELRVHVATLGDRVEAEWHAAVPEQLDASGRLTVAPGAEASRLEGELSSFRAERALMEDIAAAFALPPVTSGAVHLEGGTFALDLIEGAWPDVVATLHLEGLAVGPTESELFSGDAVAEVSLTGGEHAQGTMGVTFTEGQRLNVTFADIEDEMRVRAHFDEWPKDAFISLIPASFRGSLDTIAFASVTGESDAVLTSSNWEVRTQLTSAGAEGEEGSPLYVALDARGSTEAGEPLAGEIEARLGEERVTGTAQYTEDGAYRAEVIFEDIALAPWVAFLAGEALPEGSSGTLAGTVVAVSAGEDAPLDIQPELVVTSLQYGGAELGRVDITGGARLTESLGKVRIERLEAVADDYTTRFALVEWDYGLESGNGSGNIEAAADLELLGAIFGYDDLYGEATLECETAIADSRAETTFSIASEYFGYGDLSVLIGIEARGHGEYDYEDGAGTIDDVVMMLGEGTRVAAKRTPFTTSPLRAEGALDVESDLQAFVEMELLKEAVGSARESTAFILTRDVLEVDWDVAVDAESIVLPGDVAFVTDLKFSAAGKYDGELSGRGDGNIAQLSAAGGKVTDIAGEVWFEKEQMIFPSARGRLFGGEIVAMLEVGILEPEMPIWLNAEFGDVDLALMTEEVQPPNTELTGIAAGTLAAEYSSKGLESFSLDTTSTQGFSMNRSLVKELMQTEALLGAIGSRKAEGAMDKFLGAAPQRPFDSGSLYVFLVNEQIQGEAALRSVKTRDYNGLNLTVNLSIDQSALEQSLKLLEQAGMAETGN